MPGLEAAAKIFGSNKPPKEIMQRYTLPLLGPLRNLNADAIHSLRTGGAAAERAEDLRNARIASGRYYDVARNVYGALPSAFNQVYNAGVNTDELTRGYLPELMANYRNLDLSALIPAMARSQLANMGAQNVKGNAEANKAATYGYQQPQNIWDKLGEADKVLWAGLKDAIQMAGSVYGMIGGGGGGGLLGGLMGGGKGGGGGMAPGGAGGSQPVQRFIPYSGAPAAAPSPYIGSPVAPAPAAPSYNYPVSPYGYPSPSVPSAPYEGEQPYPYLG